MNERNLETIYEKYGWNGKFFLLTRDHTVEITELGGGFDGKPIDIKGSLFHYANQWLYQKPSTEPDIFGRNYLDQMFIALCIQLHVFMVGDHEFKSLVTRKASEKYLVRVRYDNEDIEMEVVEMFDYFTQKLKEERP